MGLGIAQYRMRVGRFVFALKHKKSLSLFDVLCACVIFYSKSKLDTIAVIVSMHFIASYNCTYGPVRVEKPSKGDLSN
jgi:hypothetical protein